MTNRDKFEAWFEDYTGYTVNEHPSANVVEMMWQAWQAALASQQPDNSVKSDADWIEWSGGECPVGEQTLVEYRTSQGSEEIQPAYNLRWTWNGGNTPRGGDIIAYRVVEDQECPECREIEQRKERLIREVEKSIAELLLSSRKRLEIEKLEPTQDEIENRILRANLVLKP